MTAQSVLEDGSAVSRADRALFVVERAMALLAGMTILGVMFVSVANILGRKLLNMPVPGFVDWMEQAVPLIAFFGIAFCQRLGGHIRMDLVLGNLKGRSVWIFEFIGILVILAISIVIMWGSWLHFERSFDWNAPMWSRDSTIDIGLPIWPIKLVVPVMLGFLCLRCILQLWAYAVAIRDGGDRPVAVPLIETAAEQAQHEAETVSGLDDDAASAEGSR
ncbi:TRAP transporter small permease [Limibaculum sp. M0105]|uniref:TRAP transporter small permease protein n=1 Tax=Thermohalobaculum xanthum TaxID=2753746 RepID=A0A8J7M755_9RHOB|nr:TRAP transporter small permease [Thermohalobaculum xanthum]MBK0399836.1 TRAP transporter small permease [Thermohalobaculum xanthum]